MRGAFLDDRLHHVRIADVPRAPAVAHKDISRRFDAAHAVNFTTVASTASAPCSLIGTSSSESEIICRRRLLIVLLPPRIDNTFMMPPPQPGCPKRYRQEIAAHRSGFTLTNNSIASRSRPPRRSTADGAEDLSPGGYDHLGATSRGVEPFVDTMVATARVSPLSRNFFT